MRDKIIAAAFVIQVLNRIKDGYPTPTLYESIDYIEEAESIADLFVEAVEKRKEEEEERLRRRRR